MTIFQEKEESRETLKYSRSASEDTLTTMGKLTAFTKQLDMVLFNDAVTDMYIDQFLKGIHEKLTFWYTGFQKIHII